MTDPFAKYRREKGPVSKDRQTEAPILTYEVTYLSRGWAILLLLLWTPVMIALTVLMVLYERELDAVPYSTGLRAAAMLLLIASLIVVPLLGPASRRHWALFADRIEIRERPIVPLVGRYRVARLPFREIAAARLGEALNGMNIFEVQTRDGARFRLAPRHIGGGRHVQLDVAGFDSFVGAIGETIDRSGVQRPPGEALHTLTSGLAGLVILGTVCALLAALCGLGAYIVLSEGELLGAQLLLFTAPFLLLFGALFLTRWRKWRAV